MMDSSDDTDDEEIKLGVAWTEPKVIAFPVSSPSNQIQIRESPKHNQDPQMEYIQNSVNNTPSTSTAPNGSKAAAASLDKVPAMKRSTSSLIKEIKYGEDGLPILPLKVGVVTLLSLGVINYTNSLYHTTKHIFPVGFKTSRLYPSTVKSNNQAVYTSSILEGDNGPLFTIEADDAPGKVWSGPSMSNVWLQVAKGKQNLYI